MNYKGIKLTVTFITLINSIISFFTTSSLSIFISSSIIYMANNILLLIDMKDIESKKISFLNSVILKIEFLIIGILFLFGFRSQELVSLLTSLNINFDDILLKIKFFVSLVMVISSFILPTIIALLDSDKDIEVKKRSRKIAQGTNDKYKVTMMQREEYYRQFHQKQIADKSLRKNNSNKSKNKSKNKRKRKK